MSPCTHTSVRLFGSNYRLLGRASLPVTVLASPGCRPRHHVYAVDAPGQMTVLCLT